MKPIYSWMMMSNCLNEQTVPRSGYDRYWIRWRTYTHLTSQTHYGHFIWKNLALLEVFGNWVKYVTVLSFFLTYLRVESTPRYSGTQVIATGYPVPKTGKAALVPTNLKWKRWLLVVNTNIDVADDEFFWTNREDKLRPKSSIAFALHTSAN